MTPPARIFDRYVVVDWSAAGRPKRGADSIWIAVVDDADPADAAPRLWNPATRHEASALLTDLAAEGTGIRTLLAVDAPLGYPAGTAERFRLDRRPPWRAMWAEVAERLVDDGANRNNRFEVAAELNRRGGGDGPFWGRHADHAVDGLTPTKPTAASVAEWRACEHHLRRQGRRPASCWQLLGAGSVGGQALTLLPVLERLVASGKVEVWPFTTGLDAPRVGAGTTVIAETWPTAFDLDLPIHWIRDAAQVDGVARHLRATDREGALAAWFAPGLPPEGVDVVVGEEGWVLAPPLDGDTPAVRPPST